ncbi:Beta-galactosidase C-terminal domain, partial [Enterobacter kobei]|nr:Beta-galactosidase C-terminal domain [Enterobacter kobei]
EYLFIMNFTEETQPLVLGSEVKDIITGEQLHGSIKLEKYEVRIVEKAKG